MVKTDDNRITLESGQAESGAYAIEARADVSVFVSDENGVVVRKIEEGWKDPGEHAFQWDGRDNAGRKASTGVYVYRLEAGLLNETRRMVLVK